MNTRTELNAAILTVPPEMVPRVGMPIEVLDRLHLERWAWSQQFGVAGLLAMQSVDLRASKARRAALVGTSKARSRELRMGHVPALFGRALRDLAFTPAVGAVQAFLADPDAAMLVLSGPSGAGKTVAGWFGYVEGSPDDLDRAPEAFVEARSIGLMSDFGEDGDRLQAMKGARMLVIDDLGVDTLDAHGVALGRVNDIVRARHQDELRTLITTNLSSGDFRRRYGDRIWNRIIDTGRFIEVASTPDRPSSVAG